MKRTVTLAYGGTAKWIFRFINPVKKRIIKTSCVMHKAINNNSIETIRNCGFKKEYDFFKRNISYINEGVVWADQDFKSINHFFHYEKERGLFGFSNAYDEFLTYYKKSKEYIERGNVEKALFYLGASCHLLQDSTVPHHVQNKLLKKHRSFELWIIDRYSINGYIYPVNEIEMHDSLKEFITSNVKFAYETYDYSSKYEEINKKYLYVSERIINKAQKSTAGLMIKYFNEIAKELKEK